MSIALVGQFGNGGDSYGSPGPTISYSSTGGNTLIITGLLYTGTTAITGITSVTDSAGNTWQFSTVNSSKPPSAAEGTSGDYVCTFVAWCIGASAITSVTIHDGTGNTDFWRICISEWSGVVSADSGAAASGTGTNASATLTLGNAGDLVVGCADSAGGSIASLPSGWTAFTNGAVNCAYDLPGMAGSYPVTFTTDGAGADFAVAAMSFSPVAVLASAAPFMHLPALVAAQRAGDYTS